MHLAYFIYRKAAHVNRDIHGKDWHLLYPAPCGLPTFEFLLIVTEALQATPVPDGCKTVRL